MFYEISRETFKQRLIGPLNFYFVYLGRPKKGLIFDCEKSFVIHYDKDFLKKFKKKITSLQTNIILYSLNHNKDLKKASEELKNAGYQFVYFYQGGPRDIVLDKGLN